MAPEPSSPALVARGDDSTRLIVRGIPAATVSAPSGEEVVSAAVVSLRFWRDHDGRYQLEFSAPWRDFPSDDAVADATRINAWIEQAVRQHPAQYRWVHKRFRQP